LQPSASAVAAPITSKQNLAVSIGKNTFFGIVASIVQVGTRFVTVPIVIYHLGLSGYGIWSIIMVTVSYMRLGAMGLKAAFQKYVAEATFSGDFEQTSRLLSTGSAGMAILSLLGILPLALLSKPLAHLLGVPGPFLHSAAGGIMLLAAGMIVTPQGAAYDAIVCGAHRIDLPRKFNTILSVFEAAAIIVVLHLGFGLMAMSAVMMASGLVYFLLCYIYSRSTLPEVKVKVSYVTKTVARELIRFAGTFQLLNVMEVIYGAMLPIAILRGFGADATGVLALCGRLVSPVVMCLYAFMIPVLSGSAMVYATGSSERLKALVEKAFRATLGISFLPLALASAFGTSVIYAWTGQADSRLRLAVYLTCLATLFQAFSMLGLILYRASGRALVDNLREVLRIGVLLPIVIYARELGFYGALAGVAGAEFVGMTFMLLALRKAGVALQGRKLLNDLGRFAAAVATIIVTAEIAARIPLPQVSSARAFETLRLGVIGLAVLASSWPALYFSRAVSKGDLSAIVSIFRPRTRSLVTESATVESPTDVG
jgi:O-antigen/teichoic acid export membrane protein